MTMELKPGGLYEDSRGYAYKYCPWGRQSYYQQEAPWMAVSVSNCAPGNYLIRDHPEWPLFELQASSVPISENEV